MFENKSLKYNTDILTFDNLEIAWPEQIQIGDQIWTTRNLTVDDGGEGIYTQTVTYDGITYQTEYYYTWDAAARVAASIAGWHLPTGDEWAAMGTYLENISSKLHDIGLHAKYSWSEITWYTSDSELRNATGFTALPAGYINLRDNNSLVNFEKRAYWWTATQQGAYTDTHKYRYLHNKKGIQGNYENDDWSAFSVRLIKDA